MMKLFKALAVASMLAFVGTTVVAPLVVATEVHAADKKKSKKPVKKSVKGKKKKVKAAKSCGTFKYKKGKKCVDARVTPVKK